MCTPEISEERLLDQVLARAPYSPRLGVSIRESVISDV